MSRRLLLATTNAGKQDEFRRLLAPLAADVVAPADVGLDLEVDEPFDTYAENAATKAAAFARAAGLPSLADDSGIEVAALDWGPGVRSARWGGGRNAERLVETLAGATDRRARMVCALALAVPGDPEPEIEIFTGEVSGWVTTAPRGERGFGYDPVFELPDGRTTAELEEAEKDRISHRGRAVAAALPRLRELLGGR
ncbi:MAG TPA: non-canonical purine NTP pyrophosphatase [Candidatus Limnocylindria bacterium]|nr:non-canonical purine NTP pyrophosphatase [Candidatus Limnocylindria bacterium]